MSGRIFFKLLPLSIEDITAPVKTCLCSLVMLSPESVENASLSALSKMIRFQQLRVLISSHLEL